MRRSRIERLVPVAILMTLALAIVPASSATADGTLTFTGTSAEYGTEWTLTAADPNAPYSYNGYQSNVVMRGAPDGYQASGYMSNTQYNKPGATAVIYPDYGRRPLAPGRYEIDFGAASVMGFYGTATPISLVISPAKLDIVTRALADTTDPTSAVVSLTFTGDFVDAFTTTTEPQSPLTPGGSWVVTITDEAGESTEHTIDRDAESDVLAASFLWSDSKPGEEYTISTRFVKKGATAEYFDIASESSFSYTAPVADREYKTSPASAPAALVPQEQALFSVPIWWAILAGIILIALLTFTIVFSVRLARSSRPTKEGATSDV